MIPVATTMRPNKIMLMIIIGLIVVVVVVVIMLRWASGIAEGLRRNPTAVIRNFYVEVGLSSEDVARWLTCMKNSHYWWVTKLHRSNRSSSSSSSRPNRSRRQRIACLSHAWSSASTPQVCAWNVIVRSTCFEDDRSVAFRNCQLVVRMCSWFGNAGPG